MTLWGLLLVMLSGCIDEYMPDAISTAKSHLVVDGFINPTGITTITLSRTYPVGLNSPPPPETKATVYIEQEGGNRYAMPETATKGTYQSASLKLDMSKPYHLRLTTAAGKQYASEYVAAKLTPPIDNVRWQAAADGLNIYVNSHDAKNTTQYYRWEYEETWEIMPPFRPLYEYNRFTRQMVPNTAGYPSICWGTAKSSAVALTKTTSLSQDIVADFPLRSLASTESPLRYRYSILVKQYAHTPEEYAYWSQLKKTTEDIGTLFDPLPSQITGNVRCLNDTEELAFGYVGAHSAAEKRIFISRSQLPGTWFINTGYEKCVPPDTIEMKYVDATFKSGLVVPIADVYSKSGGLRGYTAAGLDCIDCRKRGSAVRPVFW
ncbi:protein of unknown function [Hymenobacter daecheongensis DSM 21074]|uniref:DUF4249 domain-containing protein n=2 Tax=Hymenobacter daecheongensis TaxID=496053 RepID=A0A1M6AFG2_9BACT|nr:protein of unknown function [Hymenobacter daecheongensis DSM 21074]